MKKKIISLMTVLTMLMSLAVLPARAAESGTCGDDLTWTLEDGVLTISGTGEMWDYRTNTPWNDERLNIFSLNICNGVTSIGAWAFAGCNNLANVDIATSVAKVGSCAFNLTKWYNLLPDGPVYINNVLYGYKGEIKENTTLEIKEGTTYVSGTMGELVGNIDQLINIVNIIFPKNEIWIDGRAFDFTGWYENQSDGLIYINDILYGYKGFITETQSAIEIKDGIKYINRFAFNRGTGANECSEMSSVSIPNSVIYIGRASFYACGVDEIVIPNGVSHIYESTFGYCTGLKNITIPAGVTEIEDSAFEECTSLTDVYYGGSEEEWERIHIGSNNEALLNATIHYGRETAPSMGDCSTESMIFTETDGGCTVSSEVRNNTGSEIPCIVYSAVYSSDGVLKACGTSEEIIFGNDVSEVSISVPCMAEKGDIIKTFVWKDADGEPLAEKEEITV